MTPPVRKKKSPRKVWLVFDRLGDVMFVQRSERAARADATHYGTSYDGPYVLTPKGPAKPRG